MRTPKSDDPRAMDLWSALLHHTPVSDREAASLDEVRAGLAELEAPFDMDAHLTHVTASAIVVDGGGRTLLLRHKRLGIWVQPGGHVDGDELLHHAAMREAFEETGIPLAHPGGRPRLIHVDAHDGGRGHRHLDVRFLLIGAGGVDFRPGADESQDLAWLTPAEVAERADDSVTDALLRLDGMS